MWKSEVSPLHMLSHGAQGLPSQGLPSECPSRHTADEGLKLRKGKQRGQGHIAETGGTEFECKFV